MRRPRGSPRSTRAARERQPRDANPDGTAENQRGREPGRGGGDQGQGAGPEAFCETPGLLGDLLPEREGHVQVGSHERKGLPLGAELGRGEPGQRLRKRRQRTQAVEGLGGVDHELAAAQGGGSGGDVAGEPGHADHLHRRSAQSPAAASKTSGSHAAAAGGSWPDRASDQESPCTA
jgi:hypothetical protein